MKVKDIIKDDKFNEFLGYEIEAYNKRPAPQEGCRYRRTPYDALKDAGIFTVEGIRETFIKVANLESDLPKSQRDAITGLVFRVAQTVVNYRAKQEVEAKKQRGNYLYDKGKKAYRSIMEYDILDYILYGRTASIDLLLAFQRVSYSFGFAAGTLL